MLKACTAFTFVLVFANVSLAATIVWNSYLDENGKATDKLNTIVKFFGSLNAVNSYN